MSRKSGREIVQKRELYLAVTALLIITAIIIGNSISGLAKPSVSESPSYKYYTSITIEKGDTLWSIASEYMTSEYHGIEEYIMEVRSLNHLYGDGIYAGEHLTIPYYSQQKL